MKIVYLFLFAIIFSLTVFGQQSYEGRTFSRGRIVTADSKIIEGQAMAISADSVELYVNNFQERLVLGLNQVNKIQEYNGNWSTTGTIAGCIIGCGIGVVVALGTEQTTTDGYIQTTTIQTWPIYLFTFGCGLVGYLIGAANESWATIYSKSTAFFKSFEFYENTRTGGLCLSYNLHL